MSLEDSIFEKIGQKLGPRGLTWTPFSEKYRKWLITDSHEKCPNGHFFFFWKSYQNGKLWINIMLIFRLCTTCGFRKCILLHVHNEYSWCKTTWEGQKVSKTPFHFSWNNIQPCNYMYRISVGFKFIIYFFSMDGHHRFYGKKNITLNLIKFLFDVLHFPPKSCFLRYQTS